jgi:hypothetical protein
MRFILRQRLTECAEKKRCPFIFFSCSEPLLHPEQGTLLTEAATLRGCADEGKPRRR